MTVEEREAREVRILARSMFRALVQHGYDTRQLVALVTAMIELATERLRAPGSDAAT
jgi:hypothetical protein